MKLPDEPSESITRLNPHLFSKQVAPLAQAVVPHTDLVISASTDESKLNKTERAWLRQLRLTHPETHLGIQSITLKLADDCRYTPDFWTIDPKGQFFFWEVKGFFRDDAKVKIKVAARQFRWARFVLVTKDKTGFHDQPVNP